MKIWRSTPDKALLILATLLVLGYNYHEVREACQKHFLKSEHLLDWSTLEGDNIQYGGDWNEPGNLIFIGGFFFMCAFPVLVGSLIGLFCRESPIKSKKKKGPFIRLLGVLLYVFIGVYLIALFFWGFALLVSHFVAAALAAGLLVFWGGYIFVVFLLLRILKRVFLYVFFGGD